MKRPVQSVPAIPANPPKQDDTKRRHSTAPKSPTVKSPVILYKERKKSMPPETTTGKLRPMSIVLEPDTLQVTGGVHQSVSEPIMQSVGVKIYEPSLVEMCPMKLLEHKNVN